MINKIPELKKLELNKENVIELLFKCKANKNTKRVIIPNFYSITSTRKAPPIQLDEHIAIEHSRLIRYWVGQIKTIHEKKDTLTPAAGFFNYKGEKWTDDNRALIALYYLTAATRNLPRFKDGPTCAETSSLQPFYGTNLFPTFAPSDPNFELEDARKALGDLGVKLPDDLSELD